MVLDGRIEVADDLKLLESTSEENLNQVGNEETAFSFRRVRAVYLTLDTFHTCSQAFFVNP